MCQRDTKKKEEKERQVKYKLLVKPQSAWNFHTLLLKMQNDKATMGNCVALSHNILKIFLTI